MSYYKFMTSSYQTSLPLAHRTFRSSSIERTYTSNAATAGSSRFSRATTAPPDLSDCSYYGVMPFNRSLAVIDDHIKARSSSMAPVGTYSRAYTSHGPYGASTSFDYKVVDYANRLDNEESTRSYINSLRSDYQSRASWGASSSLDSAHATWGAAYGRAASGASSSQAYADRLKARTTDFNKYRLDSRDLYSYKHYRKSNATLEERNTRAQSPIMSREIDRYYKTERRASYLGDISSGGQRDFRYYNYRHVPYYGGSDYYSYVPRVTRVWNRETYPHYVPTYPVTVNSFC